MNKKKILVIEGIPPSNNKFIGQNKRWSYQKYKKEWNQIIGSALKHSHKFSSVPYEHALIHIHYIFPDRRRRDPDNYSGKMLLDPLVTHGVIVDDSFKNIELRLSAEYQKHISKTVIEITELPTE